MINVSTSAFHARRTQPGRIGIRPGRCLRRLSPFLVHTRRQFRARTPRGMNESTRACRRFPLCKKMESWRNDSGFRPKSVQAQSRWCMRGIVASDTCAARISSRPPRRGGPCPVRRRCRASDLSNCVGARPPLKRTLLAPRQCSAVTCSRRRYAAAHGLGWGAGAGRGPAAGEAL